MEILTPSQLTAQGLVLFVEIGKFAVDVLDEIEEFDSKQRQLDWDLMDDTADNMAMPEGMNLHEMSMGVVPVSAPPLSASGGEDA